MARTSTQLSRPLATQQRGLSLEQAWTAARASHDVRERLWASSLEVLATLTGSSAAVAFTVTPDGRRVPRLAHATKRVPLRKFVADVATLDPVDPFAVPRARRARAVICGHAPMAARSFADRRTAREGLQPPLFIYLWSGGDIGAGIALGRTTADPAYTKTDSDLLMRIQPLLQEALSRPPSAPRPRGVRLTAREREVADLVAAGSSNAAIAGVLGMRETTVKAHLTHVYRKLRVRSRTELAANLAIQRTGERLAG